MDYSRKIAPYHNGLQHRTKFKKIYRFSDKNRINPINFNAGTLKFSDKFDH